MHRVQAYVRIRFRYVCFLCGERLAVSAAVGESVSAEDSRRRRAKILPFRADRPSVALLLTYPKTVPELTRNPSLLPVQWCETLAVNSEKVSAGVSPRPITEREGILV